MNSYTREFDHQMDERVVKLWREGKFKEFCTMLPEYADYCFGEGNMHDTVMLLGLLGWDKYDGKVEFITELFASSGTGQVNAVFPLPAAFAVAPSGWIPGRWPMASMTTPSCI